MSELTCSLFASHQPAVWCFVWIKNTKYLSLLSSRISFVGPWNTSPCNTYFFDKPAHPQCCCIDLHRQLIYIWKCFFFIIRNASQYLLAAFVGKSRFTRLLVSRVSYHEYINMVHLHKHATQKKLQSPWSWICDAQLLHEHEIIWHLLNKHADSSFLIQSNGRLGRFWL